MLFKLLKPTVRVKRVEDISTLQGEAEFLAGRHSRRKEFIRILRIAFEFIRAFRKFHFLPAAVTVFGSARFKEDHRYYDLARKLGQKIAIEGLTVITGGGPGIMEAANRGAKEAGGLSVGANIMLPMEQSPNPYLDKVVYFYYFFVRKVILVKYSYAFIIFPGGFGTLDELSEALTLIQTGKLYNFPVILIGKDYWKGLTDWIDNTLIPNKTINEEDLKYFHVTDDLDLAVQLILEQTKKLKIPLTRLTTQ